MSQMAFEHLLLGGLLGGLIVLEALIGIVGIKLVTTRLDRTLRLLGSLVVQESERVQLLLRG
jgi:hypothetical protein